MADGSTNVPGVSAAHLAKHTNNKENPHGLTKAQLGLDKVDNTSDAEKPVSAAQETAIAEAKKAGTDAQESVNTHTENKQNPHGVTATQVGADPAGTAANIVSSHNTSTEAHNDIRLLLSELSTKVNNFLDSDDATLDELSELISAIKDNAGTIEQITAGKVNVTDIINDLVTNLSDRPLSAAMGVELKRLIDNVSIAVDATLSVEGQAADAKAVGDKISQLSTNIADISSKASDAKSTADSAKTTANEALNKVKELSQNGGSGAVNVNFTVVGGTTEPVNPSENTIWINTDEEVTTSALSKVEPVSPVEGMVWIFTGDSSNVSFDVLKTDSSQFCTIHPISAKQYVSSAWVDVTAQVYQGGDWNVARAPTMYIVKDGITLYTFSKSSANNVVQQGNYVQIYGSGGGYHSAWVSKIDLTDYDTLTVEGTFTTDAGCELCAWADGNSSPTYENHVASVALTATGASLDVSSLSGLYKVGITNVYTNSNTITTMVLK